MAGGNKTLLGIIIVILLAIIVYFILSVIVGVVKVLFSPWFWAIIVILLLGYLLLKSGVTRRK